MSPAYRAALAAARTVDALLVEGAVPFIAGDTQSYLKSYSAYAVSKVALNRGVRLLADEITKNAFETRQRRLLYGELAKADEPSVAVCCVSPGWCSTDMGTGVAPRWPREGAASIFGALEALETDRRLHGAYISHQGQRVYIE